MKMKRILLTLTTLSVFGSYIGDVTATTIDETTESVERSLQKIATEINELNDIRIIEEKLNAGLAFCNSNQNRWYDIVDLDQYLSYNIKELLRSVSDSGLVKLLQNYQGIHDVFNSSDKEAGYDFTELATYINAIYHGDSGWVIVLEEKVRPLVNEKLNGSEKLSLLGALKTFDTETDWSELLQLNSTIEAETTFPTPHQTSLEEVKDEVTTFGPTSDLMITDSREKEKTPPISKSSSQQSLKNDELEEIEPLQESETQQSFDDNKITKIEEEEELTKSEKTTDQYQKTLTSDLHPTSPMTTHEEEEEISSISKSSSQQSLKDNELEERDPLQKSEDKLSSIADLNTTEVEPTPVKTFQKTDLETLESVEEDETTNTEISSAASSENFSITDDTENPTFTFATFNPKALPTEETVRGMVGQSEDQELNFEVPTFLDRIELVDPESINAFENEKVQQELDKLTQTMDQLSNQQGDLIVKKASIEKKQTTLKRELSQITEKETSTRADFFQKQQQINELELALGELKNEARDLEKQLKQIDTEKIKVQQQIEELNNKFIDFNQKYSEATQKIRSQYEQLQENGRQILDLQRKVSTYTENERELNSQMFGLRNSLTQAQTELDAWKKFASEQLSGADTPIMAAEKLQQIRESAGSVDKGAVEIEVLKAIFGKNAPNSIEAAKTLIESNQQAANAQEELRTQLEQAKEVQKTMETQKTEYERQIEELRQQLATRPLFLANPKSIGARIASPTSSEDKTTAILSLKASLSNFSINNSQGCEAAFKKRLAENGIIDTTFQQKMWNAVSTRNDSKVGDIFDEILQPLF